MTMRHLPLRALPALSLALASIPGTAARPQAVQTERARVLGTVNQALSTSRSGRFSVARRSLETSLAGCGAGQNGRECRILFASGLGSLLLQQGSADRKNSDSLYTGAVGYYDRILREAPDNTEAVYGKALAYRAMGPHEWMEPFFTEAPKTDLGRAALYYTFQGDYYASARRWDDAARAYRQAVRQDIEEDGARSGLVEALSAIGAPASRELLQAARDWESRYPESARNAYRAILTTSFAPGNQRDATADSAIVGLLRVQSRSRLALADVPREVSPAWTPVREIHDFLNSAKVAVAPWWLEGTERPSVLAQTALAGGQAAIAAQKYDDAERLFLEGMKTARRSSTVALDLQRELALLYFHHAALDPDRRKFDALEQNIFEGKMGALAAGDLEAAQRYHTTLGLIYAERGVWTSAAPARNAQQQLAWALDKAEERERRQGFYQPLPELRLLLARGLDSLGSGRAAARRYAEAARAFLDADDLTASDSAARNAARLGDEVNGAELKALLSLRRDLAGGGDAAKAVCSGPAIATIRRSGDAAFAARQQFKLLADCAKLDAASAQRSHAIAAFKLVDSAGVALVGGNDVARFERIMVAMLQPFGVAIETTHLDPAPPAGGPFIKVTLPGETVPFWHGVSLDDVIAARIVAVLGGAARPFPLAVAAGVVTLSPAARLTDALIARIKTVSGVRSVRVAG